MFHLFRPRIKIVSGVLPDDRPPELKAKDYKTEELIKQPIMALQWQTWEEWKSKPENLKMLNDIAVNHQGGVGSCAAQASSLALAINNYLEDKKFLKLSAKPIYARRKNKPNAGMYMDDMGTICINYGTIPEVLYPTPNDNEINMSSLDDYISAYEAMAKALRAKNYFWLNPNIDSFANILSLNKPIVLTVVFGDGEFDGLVPLILSDQTKYGHALCMKEGTMVLTENGYKPIEQIKVGEKVLAHTGKFRKVVKLFKRYYTGEMIEVKNRNGIDNIMMTPEHPVLAQIEKTKFHDKKRALKKNIEGFNWTAVQDLSPSNFVVNVKYPNELKTIDKDLAFLLGAYIGDGNLKLYQRGNYKKYGAVRYILDRNSKNELAEKITEIMNKKFGLLPHYYYSKRDNSFHLIFYSVKVADLFKYYCGTPQNKQINPILYSQLPEILKSFIEGWNATDGHNYVSKTCSKKEYKSYSGIFTSEKNLAYSLKIILDKLQIPYSVCYRKPREENLEKNIHKSKGGYAFSYIMSRKSYSRVYFMDKYLVSRLSQIKHIKDFKGFVYNLEVEKDNSYIVSGMIVHNCTLPRAFFTYNGKKAILIQNSWGTGIGYGGRQILTEDWFRNNRVVCGIWFEDLNNLAVFNSQITKPRYQFTREMEVGMRGEDIAMLQTCLACLSDSQGALFPLWQGQSPTGYFGGITRNAVQRFQTLYGINPVGRVGPETLAKLNEVFK